MKVHKVQDGYYARVGDFFGPVKPNANQALEALNAELESFHPLNHTYVRAKDGTMFHVFQMPSHKWNYNVITPDGKQLTGGGVQGTWREAVDQATEDAVQNFGGVNAG